MDLKGTVRPGLLKPLFVLISISVLIRFFSFFPSVINHDESTYIQVAYEMLHGKTYFVDVIDTKPVGIFLIYAFFQKIAGDSIFLFRLFTAIWIAVTALGIFAVTLKISKEKISAWTGGVSYLLATSIYTFYGVSPNTELFFNAFTIWAFYLILEKQNWWRVAIAGLFLGFAFLIKYVVVVEALVFGLFVLWQMKKRKGNWLAGFPLGFCMVLFFSIPLISVYLWYYLADHEKELLFYTFTLPGRYSVDRSIPGLLLFYLDFLGRFFPITLLVILAVKNGKKCLGDTFFLLLTWLIADLLIAGWSGKNFGHYLLQALPVYCILAGTGLAASPKLFRKIRSLKPRIAWSIGVGIFVLYSFLHKTEYFDKKDIPKEIASQLRKELKPNDNIYTGNYHQIIYFLLHKQSPTRYVHRSLIWDKHHSSILEIDLEEEARIILKQDPRFVILQKLRSTNPLADSFIKYYHPIDTINGEIFVYKRKMEIPGLQE